MTPETQLRKTLQLLRSMEKQGYSAPETMRSARIDFAAPWDPLALWDTVASISGFGVYDRHGSLIMKGAEGGNLVEGVIRHSMQGATLVRYMQERGQPVALPRPYMLTGRSFVVQLEELRRKRGEVVWCI